jgi:uncharacterized protein YecT (DUF1311 family)
MKMSKKDQPSASVKRFNGWTMLCILSAMVLFGLLTPLAVMSQTHKGLHQLENDKYLETDREMSGIYKKLMEIYTAEKAEDVPKRTAIIKAQQAWIKYRDLSVIAVLKRYPGGSIAASESAGIKTELTKTQIWVLRQYLP